MIGPCQWPARGVDGEVKASVRERGRGERPARTERGRGRIQQEYSSSRDKGDREGNLYTERKAQARLPQRSCPSHSRSPTTSPSSRARPGCARRAPRRLGASEEGSRAQSSSAGGPCGRARGRSRRVRPTTMTTTKGGRRALPRTRGRSAGRCPRWREACGHEGGQSQRKLDEFGPRMSEVRARSSGPVRVEERRGQQADAPQSHDVGLALELAALARVDGLGEDAEPAVSALGQRAAERVVDEGPEERRHRVQERAHDCERL